MKNFSTKFIATVTVFMMILSLAACSQKASSPVSVHNAISTSAAEYPADGEAGAYLGADDVSEEMLTYDMNSEPMNNAPGQGQDDSNIPSGNMLIRRITMSISTESFDEMVNTVRTQVNEKQGYFEDMSITGTGNEGDYKNGTFVIRVPADQLDALTASLEGCGIVTYASESTEDVTLDYVDIQAHLEALRTEQDSLMDLLAQAEDLDTIVQLQEYLTDVRYEIEYYESQSRTLDNLVDYATLTLNLTQVVKEEEPVEIEEIRNETFSDKIKAEFNDSMDEMKLNCKGAVIYYAGKLPELTIRLVGAIVLTITSMIIYKTSKKKSSVKKSKKSASSGSDKKS